MKNAIVGQSGGPTAAINASLCGVIEGVAAAVREGKIGKIYGMENGMEGLLAGRVRDISYLIENERERELLALTPASALGSCRMKLPASLSDPLYEQVFATLEELDVGYVFYIGGNDSMDSTAKLSAAAEARGLDISVVGVPKTIDNDLMGTDHTPGFGSAAKYIATVMSEIVCDCSVYTKKAVTVVEIMGRDAGWLTAAAGLASLVGRGPDYVYLPERVFSFDGFIDDLLAALERHPDVVVAVSEGARLADGTYVGAAAQSGVRDAFGHRYLAGAGKALEMLIRERIGCKVRSVELNLPQRCAGHCLSRTDITESLEVGREAVRCALGGHTGVMMTLERIAGDAYGIRVSHGRVADIANGVRTVPDAFINEAGNGITEACLAYLEPLILGECRIPYVHGLPQHFSF